MVLEGEDVAPLAGSHRWPPLNAFGRRGAPRTPVPHNPSDEPHVRGMDPCQIIEGKLSERAAEDAIDVLSRYRPQKARIQAVDAFQQEHVALAELQLLPALRAGHARREIEMSGLHRLSVEKSTEVVTQQIELQCF